MDLTIIAIAGVSMFFSFAILKWKFTHGRIADGVLDAIIMTTMLYVTAGSATGMVTAMIGSTLFSLYLLWSPFDLEAFEDEIALQDTKAA